MTRCLVCILAETRAHRVTWKHFKNRVIDPLHADLAVCVSVPEDYDFDNPFWQYAKYKWPIPEYSDWGEAYDGAQGEYLAGSGQPRGNWRRLLEIKDQWLGGIRGPGQHPGSAGILLYFRWFLLQQIKLEGLADRYDRFIITRSDFIWEVPHPSLDLLDDGSIWVPDGEGYMGITDRHAVLSRNNYEAYLDILRNVLLTPDQTYEAMRHKSNWNLEQFIVFSLQDYFHQGRIKYFPYGMYTVREWNGPTSWRRGTWSDELGYYIKYDSEYLSAQQLKKIVQRSVDWNPILKATPDAGFNSLLLDNTSRLLVPTDQGIGVRLDESPMSDDESVILIDYIDGRGTIFVGTAGLGSWQRRPLLEVQVTVTERNTFILTTENNTRAISINDKGQLISSDSLQLRYEFKIRNKFQPG